MCRNYAHKSAQSVLLQKDSAFLVSDDRMVRIDSRCRNCRGRPRFDGAALSYSSSVINLPASPSNRIRVRAPAENYVYAINKPI
jgi:hypothetical protein